MSIPGLESTEPLRLGTLDLCCHGASPAAAEPGSSAGLAADAALHTVGADAGASARHQRKAVLAIQQVFASPAVMALQGIADQRTLADLASAASTAATSYRAYLLDAAAQSSHLDSHLGFLVDSSAVSVLRLEQRGEEETYTDADSAGPHPVWQQPPLVLQVEPHAGKPRDALTLINVLLAPLNKSAGGVITAHHREQRRQQARSLAALVMDYTDRGEKVLVLGNFNTPEGSRDASDVLGVLTGSSPGVRQEGTDLHSPALTDISTALTDEQRYNAFNDGHPVMLERILVPASLRTTVQQPHFTAGLSPDSVLTDETPAGLGDHDGQIATILMSAPVRAAGTPQLFSGDFGGEVIGTTSPPQSLSFKADATNTDPVIFQPATITGADSADFAVTGDTCGTLQPGQQCFVTLTFTPAATGARSATLSLPNNSANASNYTLQLTGTGTDLTAALTPASSDFGSVVVGERSPASLFTWTNTSPVPLQITSVAVAGSASSTAADFVLAGTTCSGTVASGAACTASVVFAPSSTGPQAASITIQSTATGSFKALHSTLAGTGVSPLSVAPAALDFGSVDVTARSAAQTVTFTNRSSKDVPLDSLSTLGDFLTSSTCSAHLAAKASCTATVVFTPTVAGLRTGTLTLASSGASATVALTGNGVDFSITIAPASGSTIAGDGVSPVLTLTPTPGFSNTVSLSCATTAAASQCAPEDGRVALTTAAQTPLNIGTTSKYIIIGFGGSALNRVGALLAFCSTLLLGIARRQQLARRWAMGAAGLAAALALAGCGSRQPPQNSPYTAPGTYTYSVTATDGILTHAVSYSLQVKAF